MGWYDAAIHKRSPWAHSAQPHKYRHVEYQVHGWLKTVLQCFDSEPVATQVIDN